MHQRLINGVGLLLGLLTVFAGCQVKGSVRVGGACTIDQTCLSGVCLRESKNPDGRAWIGGYCSGNCSNGNGCPQGKCLDMADGRSYCVSECTNPKDCRLGYLCSPDLKICLPDCRLGWSCGPMLACDTETGFCTGPKVTPQPLGSPCTFNDGCQGALCIPESPNSGGISWTAGTCTQDCTSSPSSCPTGSTCFRFQDGNARCLTACSGPTCRPGYVCSSDAEVCLPDCREGWSCGSSLTCDAETGSCTVTPQPLGSPCTFNDGCQDGLCIPEASTSSGTIWTAGTCTRDCTSAPLSCPSGSTCFLFQDGNSRCLTACSGPTCRPGYTCSSDAKVCLPDCRQGWSCGSSLTCDAETGSCTGPKVTPQPLGSPCTLNAGCQDGLCIPETSSSSGTLWTAGTCTQDCSSSPSCPSGSTCFLFQDGNSRCLTACSGPTCRQGYECSPDAKVCLPDCRLGWSCGSSLTCDSNTGSCTAPQPTPQPLGSPCALNAGCQGGLCIPEISNSIGVSWTAGTCTQDCGSSSSSCPSGSTCFLFQDGSSRCLTACSGPTCRQGYVCSSDAKVCLPDCRLGWSCANLICDGNTGECQAATVSDAGVKYDARPASKDASSSGAGGSGGGGSGGRSGGGGTGGGAPGPGPGPGGRGGPMW